MNERERNAFFNVPGARVGEREVRAVERALLLMKDGGDALQETLQTAVGAEPASEPTKMTSTGPVDMETPRSLKLKCW